MIRVRDSAGTVQSLTMRKNKRKVIHVLEGNGASYRGVKIIYPPAGEKLGSHQQDRVDSDEIPMEMSAAQEKNLCKYSR